jgi:hypothetical protein
MARIQTAPQPPRSSADTLDSAPLQSAPWLTPGRLIVFVIGWLTLFALGSIFIANPFQSESSAAATPNYATVMYLHGLLIGMVGLLALVTCQVLNLRSVHTRVWVTGGVLFATILSAVGGIFDKNIPGYELPMWIQIFSFFALDEILIVLLVGLISEWRTSRMSRSLPYVAAFLATLSMLGAALMGHLAGWVEEFGWNTPPLIKDFATFAGYGDQGSYVASLIGSHSHEMVVAVMALTIVLVVVQFGYSSVRGLGYVLTRVGVALVGVGTLVMTGIYVFAAFSSWAPPPWFVSGPGGANGIASDDVITGILVMGGGLVILLGLVLGRSAIALEPIGLAALWSWVLSFATVVVAGYAIEMNTAYYGAGDQSAPGAAKDAIFTWLHQDIGLFLLPTLVIVMLAIERLVVNNRRPGWIGLIAITGTTVVFIGSMVYVFVTPVLHGAGYAITTTGLLIVGIALLSTVWWGATTRLRTPVPAIPSVPEQTAAPMPAAPPERELVLR